AHLPQLRGGGSPRPSSRPSILLPPQPSPIRVVQRGLPDDRRAILAEDIDGELTAILIVLSLDITDRQRLADIVAVAAGGDVAHHLATLEDRLVADHLGAGVDLQYGEALPGAALALGEEGVAAGEAFLPGVDEEVEAGLGRGVVGPEILVEGAVSL